MFDITQEHPHYQARKGVWEMYRDLYAGGHQLKTNAERYLVRRQKEPSDVYAERLNRVFYENYVGSIIDWYAATLFRREPVVTLEGRNERAKRFYASFLEDCDRRGSGISDFFRRQITEAMVLGSSYTLLDFPRSNGPAGSRAEEERQGTTRAYLVPYSASELTNWSVDERGRFDWVVLRSRYLRREAGESGEFLEETRWSFYDQERFRIFEERKAADGKREAALVDEGKHALAGHGEVPLFEMKLPEGMWLMNKAALLQLEHLNKSNAMAWALTMGLFATPVVYSEREWNEIVGESYYIQLGPEDRFGWTEPEGKVYQIAAENLNRLKEEVYRVCYVLSQAGGAYSGGIPQSALSKQRDFAVTQEVLRSYGDTVKDTLKRILRAIEAVRDDNLTVSVSGLDEFDIGEFSAELADAERLLGLGVPSKTMRKQIFKKLAFKYLCDVRQEIKEQIAQEIESNLGTVETKEEA